MAPVWQAIPRGGGLYPIPYRVDGPAPERPADPPSTAPSAPPSEPPAEPADRAFRSRPWPMAVAVVAVPALAGEAERAEERVAVALLGYKLGYFVLDIIEVPPGVSGGDPDGGYARADALARRTDADAFIVRGSVDTDRLRRVADQVRMRIRFEGGAGWPACW
jgi:hypothetical protein